MNKIQEILERFAAEIRAAALEEAFESMRAAMGHGGQVRRRPGRPPGSRVRGGGKRDPRTLDALASKLNAAIRAKPGSRVEEIARALGTNTKELALPMKKLLASKKIRKTGTRRATKYFPVRP